MNSLGKRNRRAQIRLSFGFLVSMILIIVFIAAAIYVVGKMLALKNYSQIKQFKQQLQQDINTQWRGEFGSENYQYFLPKKIKKVCFSGGIGGNFHFLPPGVSPDDKFEHINVSSGFCINSTGRVNVKLVKIYDEPLVNVQRT